jgi:6,7-dimethyl-8-ribityllumazine synthase
MAVEILVNVDVPDLEAAIDFYERATDLRLRRRLFEGTVAELAGASVPVVLLEKAPGSAATPVATARRDYARHWTPVHLDLVVPDVEAAARRAVAAGARLEGPIEAFDWGRQACLSDPFGNGFCFLQWAATTKASEPARVPAAAGVHPRPTVATIPTFSGRGGSPHRRYAGRPASPRAPGGPLGRSGVAGVSRSGARPEPTVTVRRKENGWRGGGHGVRRSAVASALSDSFEELEMAKRRYAFVKANWHAGIVERALEGFRNEIGAAEVEVFDVPGAFEIPLLARDLAATGRFDAVIGAAFVVDGGIYRHEFVASTVLEGMMRAQMDADVPVLSIVLTPHHFQESVEHVAFFRDHFVRKGEEAARAARAIGDVRDALAA